MAAPEPQTHTFSLVVADRPGVLVRIALVFARRGFNIESLAVSPGAVGGFARMTLTSRGHGEARAQILKQLAKLIDVVFVTDHESDTPVTVEIALVKVPCPAERRAELLGLLERHGGKLMDSADDILVLQIAGSPENIDGFLEKLGTKHLQELVRSGPIVMDRGPSRFLDLLRRYG
jgi:acetolactate synthase-1/3 small subunit